MHMHIHISSLQTNHVHGCIRVHLSSLVQLEIVASCSSTTHCKALMSHLIVFVVMGNLLEEVLRKSQVIMSCGKTKKTSTLLKSNG